MDMDGNSWSINAELHYSTINGNDRICSCRDSCVNNGSMAIYQGQVMEVVLIAISTAFNFVIIMHKLRHERVFDGVIDFVTMVTLGSVFGGTLGGMTIAMISGALVSVYLWFQPFRIVIPKELMNKIFKAINITVVVLLIVASIVFVANKYM